MRDLAPPRRRYSRQTWPALRASSTAIALNVTPRRLIASAAPLAVSNAADTSAHTIEQALRAPPPRPLPRASRDGGPDWGSAPNTSSRMDESTAVITGIRPPLEARL